MQQSNAPTPGVPPVLPPAPIIEATFAFAQSCVLLAAVELDLFTHIAHGRETAEQLAEAAQVAEPALLRLLGALVAMGYVQQNASPHSTRYTLTPLSERYLVRDHTTYIGDVVLQIRQEWPAWIHLTEIIRSGQSVRYINEEPLGGPFFEPLAESLFPLLYPIMRRICTRLEVGTRQHGLHILDLGAGTAPSAIAALELDREARALLVDFAPVLERARNYAQKHGVEDRMSYLPTSLDTLQLEEAQFDLAFASHVLRIVGADLTRKLIEQCYHALKPGGQLVIVETYNEPDQIHKLFPHIVSLNMLVNTRCGDTFTLQQISEWLHTTGFQTEVWPNVGPDLIVTATRPTTK